MKYEQLKEKLNNHSYTWVITGVGGFIGSHLLETFLRLSQYVIGLDNFSTGYALNLKQVKQEVSEQQWKCFQFIEGDIADLSVCRELVKNSDFTLHQAALGSVVRSIKNPYKTNEKNVTGFLNILIACKEAKVKRLVYASSSTVYGDHEKLPKVEHIIGKPLSPYGASKHANEMYANAFSHCYGLSSIGLRYFNVFGPRQNINGEYAAVIPNWVNKIAKRNPVVVFGDGENSRDFCYIDNVVQANLLAALTTDKAATNQVYNVALNKRTSLNKLFYLIRNNLGLHFSNLETIKPIYKDPRPGDIKHSKADIKKISKLLGYNPIIDLETGLNKYINWYINNLNIS